jgi:selenide,water dikinase
VDDPFTFGEIAAANALSDVYAMGGTPLIALNIVGFPVDLPKEILGRILSGGASKAAEAGVLIVGGHTVDDKEPKYGLAVTGAVQPGRQITNAGALAGDALVLTKPIGTGIITTAAKFQDVEPEVLEGAVETMRSLNHSASRAMVETGVHACTDVTGFGLLGHLHGMLKASNAGARITAGAVPQIDGAWELVQRGVSPGGTGRNLDSVDPVTAWGPGVDHAMKLLLSDAQTSGGLLISVAADRLDHLLRELASAGVEGAAVIGEVVEREQGDGRLIEVVRY